MLVDKNKMAEILGVSVTTINRLMAKGMPKLKVGKSVRFEPEVVIQWIKDRQ